METTDTPCTEPNSASAGPLWPTFSPEFGDVKYLGRFRLKPRNTEMYYAPTSDINRAVLIIRCGKSDDDISIMPVDEVSGNEPEMDEAFKAAYDCAKRKGYIA